MEVFEKVSFGLQDRTLEQRESENALASVGGKRIYQENRKIQDEAKRMHNGKQDKIFFLVVERGTNDMMR